MECEAWGLCPFERVDTLSNVGIALLNVVPVKTQGGIYLGKRYVVHATPHSVPPFCPHQPDRQRCEQITACQAKEGPDFYISLPGKFTNDRCDKQSSNAFICHHKPKADEAGPTTFCAVPKGEPPSSPRGRCIVLDVRA